MLSLRKSKILEFKKLNFEFFLNFISNLVSLLYKSLKFSKNYVFGVILKAYAGAFIRLSVIEIVNFSPSCFQSKAFS